MSSYIELQPVLQEPGVREALRAAINAKAKARAKRERRIEVVENKWPPKCGTETEYTNFHCRCPRCCAAALAARKQRADAHNGRPVK